MVFRTHFFLEKSSKTENRSKLEVGNTDNLKNFFIHFELVKNLIF